MFDDEDWILPTEPLKAVMTHIVKPLNGRECRFYGALAPCQRPDPVLYDLGNEKELVEFLPEEKTNPHLLGRGRYQETEVEFDEKVASILGDATWSTKWYYLKKMERRQQRQRDF
jgi:hypothetical protein